MCCTSRSQLGKLPHCQTLVSETGSLAHGLQSEKSQAGGGAPTGGRQKLRRSGTTHAPTRPGTPPKPAGTCSSPAVAPRRLPAPSGLCAWSRPTQGSAPARSAPTAGRRALWDLLLYTWQPSEVRVDTTHVSSWLLLLVLWVRAGYTSLVDFLLNYAQTGPPVNLAFQPGDLQTLQMEPGPAFLFTFTHSHPTPLQTTGVRNNKPRRPSPPPGPHSAGAGAQPADR